MATIITSTDSIFVPNDEKVSFQVKLSEPPRDEKAVIRVKPKDKKDKIIKVKDGDELEFKKENWYKWRTVTLKYDDDERDVGNDGRVYLKLYDKEDDNGIKSIEVLATLNKSDVSGGDDGGGEEPVTPAIVTSLNAITITESQTAQVGVKLSADPGKMVTVKVYRSEGDGDVTVEQGATLNFDSSDWDAFKVVLLSAAADTDTLNGSAVVTAAGDGLTSTSFTVTEQDTDTVVEPPAESKNIVIDPVSRIEGHLRVEVEVTDGAVSKAWSTATLYRGVEPILNGRSPYDAPHITQRLCGVCTYVHQVCSTRTIENAAALTVSENARIVRNLTLGAQYLHDHIVHFYHLHGLDWVDIVSALGADPDAVRTLQQTISPGADYIDYAGVQQKLQGLVNTGNLGPFANAYWGAGAYQLTPEENLLVTAHYLEALKLQTEAAKMMAILGGKNPHPQSTVVGGVTCGGELTAERLGRFRTLLAKTRRFVETVYLPDVKAVAAKYPEWASVGGFTNFLSYGEFPLSDVEPDDLFMPRGYIMNGDVANILNVDLDEITEHVARSWYQGTAARNPAQGETNPQYTGLDTSDRYSWLKAPRYMGEAMEVGPLARVLVAYGRGKAEFVAEVNNFLEATGLDGAALFSTLGRTAARAIETKVIGDAMPGWLDELEYNLANGNTVVFRNHTLPSSSAGVGLNEAPRGALGHWLQMDGEAIGNYQLVVPSAWNLGPRCDAGIPSPVEKALIGVPVQDPENPVEVLRVIHSFDPCIACGVHVIDTTSGKERTVQVR